MPNRKEAIYMATAKLAIQLEKSIYGPPAKHDRVWNQLWEPIGEVLKETDAYIEYWKQLKGSSDPVDLEWASECAAKKGEIDEDAFMTWLGANSHRLQITK
jgi:hypothetical protein